MIAIVEAFDAMTTEQIYRAAVSHERAMAELFRCAGTQFDPGLVEQFAQLHEVDVTDCIAKWPAAGCGCSTPSWSIPIGS